MIEDVSAALPSESALRRERQARWDSDVSENSATEDKVKTISIDSMTKGLRGRAHVR